MLKMISQLKTFLTPISVFALCFFSASLALASGYFDQMDATIQLPKKPTAQRLTAERFVRLSARLSVYALYCDDQNKSGYNTAVSNFQHRNTQLEQLAQSALGGTQAEYNKLEDERNDESLRFVDFPDVDVVCNEALNPFKAYMGQTSQALQKTLSTAPFGTL